MVNLAIGSLSQVLDPYPLKLNAQTPVTEAIARMSQTQASCALVEQEGRLVGLFAEREVVQAAAAGKIRPDVAIAGVMNQHVITLKESEGKNLITVLSALQQHQIDHLPIVMDSATTGNERWGEWERGKWGENSTQVQNTQTDQSFARRLTSSAPLLGQVLGLVSLTNLLVAPRNAGNDRTAYSPQSFSPSPRLPVPPSPLVSCLLDSTESRQVQEIVRQREQEFRALAENSPDIIARLDRGLRHVYVNPAVEQASGMPPQEFLGKTSRELGMPEAVVAFWDQSLQKVFQTGETSEIEFSLLTVNGLRYYQSRLVPEFAADGSVDSILAISRDLTKNKQTEDALRESEQCFRTVFESAPIGIAIANLQGMLLQSNQAFQEILGYTAGELQNRSCIDFTHPDERSECLKLIQELLSGQRKHFYLEKRYRRKDGCFVWVDVCVTTVCDVNGLPQYAIALIQDISKRKQAEFELQHVRAELEKRVTERTAELALANARLKQEIAERQQAQEALKAQKELLQTVLDTNPNLIFVKDSEGRYLLVNQAFANFYGRPVTDFCGKTVAEIEPNPAEVESYIAQDQDVLTSLQQKFIAEEVCQTPTGEMRWYQTIKKPLFSSDGQISQVLGVCTDITEYKQAETQRRQSEERLHLALEAAHMGFWDCDLRVGKTTWSNSLEQLYGFAPNTYDGTYKTFLARMHPDDRDRFEQANQLSLKTGEDWTIEFRIILPDSSIRWIESKGHVFYDDETGKPVRMAGINVDISDRKQAEIQIKDSLREKEVLLQEIHHRVKNNLQVISSLLDLQSQHLHEPSLLEMFRESRNRVKSMALVHEKLYQSQSFTKINFVEYVESLTNDLFYAYGMNDDNITLDLDIDEVVLNVEQAIPCGLIINELVSNALKHAFPKYAKGTIHVALKSDLSTDLNLIVKDNGIGLPKNLDFKRVQSLGLQLINVLTSQLEGTIELNCNAGTEFKIRFPQS